MLVLKTLPGNALTRVRVWNCIDQCMKYASAAEISTAEAQTELLDEVDRTATEMFKVESSLESSTEGHWTMTRAGNRDESGFLAMAAEYNLHLYIRADIERGLVIFTNQAQRPLLDYVIVDYKKYPSVCELGSFTADEPVSSLTLVRWLLKRGADPNETYEDSTIWENVLAQARDISKNISISSNTRALILEYWSDIAEVFIRYEANPRINRDSEIGSCIREAFGEWVPERARELEKWIKRSKRRWTLIRKFLVPPLRTRAPLSLEEITPLPKLNRLKSINVPEPSLSERYRGQR